MADAGYFSEESVTGGGLEGIDLFVAPDKQKHSDEVRGDGAASARVLECDRADAVQAEDGRTTGGIQVAQRNK